MSWLRLIGTHLHLKSNIVDLTDSLLPAGGTEGQALVKDSGADGDASWHNIEDIATAETDDTLVLAPDGAGGVEFRAEAGGGSPHDLLDGTENQDTLAGSVADGDQIQGNSTPKWARVPISIPGSANLVNFWGVAFGELRGAWKALFDTTNPSTQAFGDSATPGTATVAARRDHKHAMPGQPAAYATVQDEGTPVTQRSTINFVGAGVSAADSAGVTTVTISGGVGGGGSVSAVRSYISFGSNMSGQSYSP